MSPEIYEWLGKWGEPVYFGKHDKWEPVYSYNGYLYSIDRNGNLYSIPWTAMAGRSEPNWSRSPQVRFWMDQPKRPLMVRIADGLKNWIRTGRWRG